MQNYQINSDDEMVKELVRLMNALNIRLAELEVKRQETEHVLTEHKKEMVVA